jgi:hypothetical protein
VLIEVGAQQPRVEPAALQRLAHLSLSRPIEDKVLNKHCDLL